MDATQESISWETYLAAGIKALDLSKLEDAEKLFQKALIEARKDLARLRGDETEGVVVAVKEDDGGQSENIISPLVETIGKREEPDKRDRAPVKRVRLPGKDSPKNAVWTTAWPVSMTVWVSFIACKAILKRLSPFANSQSISIKDCLVTKIPRWRVL
jgi:hypothetical protein